MFGIRLLDRITDMWAFQGFLVIKVLHMTCRDCAGLCLTYVIPFTNILRNTVSRKYKITWAHGNSHYTPTKCLHIKNIQIWIGSKLQFYCQFVFFFFQNPQGSKECVRRICVWTIRIQIAGLNDSRCLIDPSIALARFIQCFLLP